ncbi:outer membrane beta-barrel family protein [Mucilaginibacter myungsuensis]|uniref:TonB-dependent receptor n=1 Tax=Mucilaginibacter myungsuensis TaxID=649104 RepID=A0A929KZK3_9SPHI|nr:outer membrane beta-barrel family protein [Mucilaginibacter myungsuensis]MBE9663512.1 TonB-dependent receptor [Mucilaginibacter myungsuensis]MDN3600250.1 TonB-dependent receptor [Mucilaginibacter myungsuensis]
MKIYRFLNLLLVIILLSATNTFAQQPAGKGSVTGKLIDSANAQPLAFATVSLIKKSDNLAAKSIQTDMDGNFKLDNMPDGAYTLRATYVGYATVNKDGFTIDATKRVFAVGIIKMIVGKGLLKEVAVTSQKSNIKLGIDRKTFAVDQSLVSQGGSATDLLSNVPSVQVDVDGNLNLRGSGNVRVLINGKPSALTGANVADILQSIPASAIENIELITNPSSKFDAEGQSGIINIILKKNARLGFNGSASMTGGNYNTYNGNLNLAYQTSKINVYGNYSYRRGDREGNGFTNRTTYRPGDLLFLNQSNNQSFGQRGGNIRTGIDINLNEQTTLGISGNFNLRNRDRFQGGLTSIYNSLGTQNQQTMQNSTSRATGNYNNDYNLDFSRKFKKQGQEFTANIGYSHGKESANDFLSLEKYSLGMLDSIGGQFNQNGGNGDNLNLQADLTLPLENGRKFEAGYRSTIANNYSNNDVSSLNPATKGYFVNNDLTNHFIYREQVHAVYSNYQQQFGNFGVQLGVRAEQVYINTLLRENGGVRNNQNYFRVYPSLFLSDKLSENQTLQLSYTRRVSRPRDRQINPFQDRSDPFNYFQGTPGLRPEDTHSFELSYINYWKALTLTSSVYHRLTNENIQMIRQPLTDQITVMTFKNISRSQNSGFELIAKVNATNNFDVTANFNSFYRQLNAAPEYNLPSSSGFAWNANLTGNYKPTKALGIQLRGDYNAPQVMSQGRMKAMYGLDAGVKYDVTKTVSLSGNVRDAFNTRRFGSTIEDNLSTIRYMQESSRRWQSRTFTFTLSYRFGSTPAPDKKKNRGMGDDMGGGDGGDGMGGGTQGTINGGGAGAAAGAKPPVVVPPVK